MSFAATSRLVADAGLRMSFAWAVMFAREKYPNCGILSPP
jgi:hypothetical protein